MYIKVDVYTTVTRKVCTLSVRLYCRLEFHLAPGQSLYNIIHTQL